MLVGIETNDGQFKPFIEAIQAYIDVVAPNKGIHVRTNSSLPAADPKVLPSMEIEGASNLPDGGKTLEDLLHKGIGDLDNGVDGSGVYIPSGSSSLHIKSYIFKRAADALEHGEDPVKEWTSSIIAETAKVRLSKIMGTLTNEEAKTALAGLVDDMIHTRDEGEREVFITQLKAMQRTLADTTLAK